MGTGNRAMIDTAQQESGAKSPRVFHPAGGTSPEPSGASADLAVPEAREHRPRQHVPDDCAPFTTFAVTPQGRGGRSHDRRACLHTRTATGARRRR
ncbi:hypothetical protein Lesp01_41900 [Lentzea sp. NBRC 102530]|nr:hypothetical protein Lesp01_41900 [Lentzea sp. NBRC 102530]